MNNRFYDNELLLRAVYPPNKKSLFWINGRMSSAALKDKRGLSVSRTYDRSKDEAVCWMRSHYEGVITSISVTSCNEAHAFLLYCPSKDNKYHSEIHGSPTQIVLSDVQAKYLAKRAVLEFWPNT